MITSYRPSCLRARQIAACVGLSANAMVFSLTSGCAGTQPRVSAPANPSLRAIQSPAGASQVDSDRVKLSRFIGVWNFRGRVAEDDGLEREVSGQAAGVLENSQFVLIDVKAMDGALAGSTSRKSGSLLLGAEPGKGLTITAWGDGAPEVRRLWGGTNSDGSVFEFREHHGRVLMRIAFETDDRWTATIRRGSGKARASYVFTRGD